MEINGTYSLIDSLLVMMFLALSILFIYFTIAFSHHWKFYSFNADFKRIAQGLYFFVSIIILIMIIFFMGIYIFDYGF